MEELIKKLTEDLDAIINSNCEQRCSNCKLNIPVIYVDNGYYDFCSTVKKLRNAL